MESAANLEGTVSVCALFPNSLMISQRYTQRYRYFFFPSQDHLIISLNIFFFYYFFLFDRNVFKRNKFFFVKAKNERNDAAEMELAANYFKFFNFYDARKGNKTFFFLGRTTFCGRQLCSGLIWCRVDNERWIDLSLSAAASPSVK